MRVMIISGSAPPMQCGVGDYSARLAQALSASPDAQVALLTSTRGTGPIQGVDVLSEMPDWTLGSLPVLWSALRGWRPDIVHFQYPTLGYADGQLPPLIPILARLAGARVVRTWHEFAPWRSLTPLRRAVGFVLQLLPTGQIVVVRPHFRDQLAAAFRAIARKERFSFVPNASAIPPSRLSEPERVALAARLRAGQSRLIASFGFVLPAKGVDLLFEIADPAVDQLLIVGGTALAPEYVAALRARADEELWRGKVVFLENLSAIAVADVLAAADAVVLPFRDGGGEWNSSIHAAAMQGTPVVTTSTKGCGFNESELIYIVPPGDVAALRAGLSQVEGRRRPIGIDQAWEGIAAAHRTIYQAELA